MGLNTGDPKPEGISFKDAYTAIHNWYGSNVHLLAGRSDDYARRSVALINALPEASTLSDLEFRAVFGEVIYGLLEWAYHKSDGRYKMAAYAHAALEAAGLSFSLSEDERAALKASQLWTYLSFNR